MGYVFAAFFGIISGLLFYGAMIRIFDKERNDEKED